VKKIKVATVSTFPPFPQLFVMKWWDWMESLNGGEFEQTPGDSEG